MKTSLLLLALVGASAGAQTLAPPLADPWLPPAVRASATAPAPQTRGAALQAQVLAKLERQFQAADTQRRGALTLDEARRAGWGFAVDNFAELDREGRGEIRLQDVQRMARERTAAR